MTLIHPVSLFLCEWEEETEFAKHKSVTKNYYLSTNKTCNCLQFWNAKMEDLTPHLTSNEQNVKKATAGSLDYANNWNTDTNKNIYALSLIKFNLILLHFTNHYNNKPNNEIIYKWHSSCS